VRGPENSDTRLLERVAALVGRRCGLHLPPEKLWMLERRLAERRGQATLRDYLDLLEGPRGAPELERLIEALRIGETRLFRLGAHLRALRRVALPEIVARRSGVARCFTIQVWSAGCASGEEPYTLAMVLDDWLAEAYGPDARFAILATDLSAEALATAREGLYTAENVTGSVPPELATRYLERESDSGCYRVGPELRQRVRFVQHNLVADRYPSGFDLVFCCNVLIYFDRATRAAVVRRLGSSLSPSGYLFLGTTEAVEPLVGDFSVLRTPDGVVHQRSPADEAATTTPPPAPAPQTDAVASVATRAAPAPEGQPTLVRLQGSYDGDRLTLELRPTLEADLRADHLILDLDGATYLEPTCARVLARLARHLERQVVLVASRPAVLRWLKRHADLLGQLPLHSTLAAARQAGE
jgi:chemotaxis protein methyltransferase CheR